jgi:hypothetical protein
VKERKKALSSDRIVTSFSEDTPLPVAGTLERAVFLFTILIGLDGFYLLSHLSCNLSI